MVRQVVRDQMFLSQKSEPVTEDDDYKSIIQDLRDTLQANSRTCVGMAANMIGVKKQIIIISLGLVSIILINPRIVRKKDMYEVEEGCLSLDGTRKATRYKQIIVEYLDESLQAQRHEFNGFVAQNIQHQIDHISGVVI